MGNLRNIWLFLSLLISTQLFAQQQFPGGGSGSYRTTFPATGNPDHIYAPIGFNLTGHIYKGPNYTGPFQTHQWWNSALWMHGTEPHSAPMYPHPLMLEAKTEGYILRYGTYDINGLNNEIESHSAVIDARVGISGRTAPNTSVDSYGDWHATFYQDHGAGNTLRMTAARGCPFAFFQRSGTSNPTIYGLNKNIVTKSTSGNSFIFSVAPEGRTVYFAVFLPAGSQVGANVAPNTAVTALGLGGYGGGWDYINIGLPAGSNYFSMAVMTDITQATLNMYEARAFNFITGTTHSYTFDEALSRLTTTFAATTTNVYGGPNTGTLQALYKHQYLYSPEASGAANTGVTYWCPRGTMRLLSGNTFTTVMTHQGLLPNLGWAHKYSVAQMRAYIDNYLPTIAIPQAPADGYNKDAFVELATIAQISSQIGYTAAKNRCLDAIQARLITWLTSPTTEDWGIFVYNSNFNYMAHYPNGFTSSGEFIDMHFHVAYMIYGAAILARYRPAFVTQYGGMVECVIRQINDYRKDMTNPGNIGWFPYLRHFDPYAGHSWADPSATNQESVSESLLFAHGTFLWGETVNNVNLRNLGALLYITESEAAKLYWYDVDQNINMNWGTPAGSYTQHHMTILRSYGGSFATFFSADDRWKHSITILPATAGSLWMVWDPNRAQTMFNHLPAGGYAAWDEHGYHYNFIHAGFNATNAKNAFINNVTTEQWINPTFPHVNGDIPVLYQWVNTFDSVGTYDNTVQADITGFSVFKKGDCKHYMIYMPPGKGPRTVNFTDGRSFLVPDDTVVVYKACGAVLPVDWVSFEGKNVENSYTKLNWTVASEKDNNRYEIYRSANGISSWEKIGEVESKNIPSLTTYGFNDYSPLHGINYYQLKQIDKDAKFSYSNIIAVNFSNSNAEDLQVYPNPAGASFTVYSLSGSLNDYSIVLRDVLGRTYAFAQSNSGGYKNEINLENFSGGLYILEATHLVYGNKFVIKVVKE